MADNLREETSVYPMMIRLAACLCLEMEASGLPGTCFCGIVVGNPVMDFCGGESCGGDGCGGQAWVRFIDAYPSSTFPATDQGLANCRAPLAFNVEVGIARCAPIGDLGGPNGYVPPTLAQNVEALRLQLADMAAMRRAVQCCFGVDDTDYIMGAYSQVDVNGGGCLGGTIQLTIWESF